MWISVKERLPEEYKLVALMNCGRHTHHVDFGDPATLPVVAAGYRSQRGGDYWAVRAERALCIDAFTHWLPLPPPPEAEA